MSHRPNGISFLYRFDLGNRDVEQPGRNILSVTSQADGDFGKANLTTESLRHAWRSTSVDDWQDIVIRADMKSTVDTFALLGHNLSETAVVMLQANYSDNWVAPPITIPVSWQRHNLVSTASFGGEYEYYRVRILDPANLCGYIEVGRIVGGRAFSMGGEDCEDIVEDFDVDYTDMAEQTATEGFFRVSTEKVKVKTFKGKFSKLETIAPNNKNYLGLTDLFEEVGSTRPFLTIVDREDPGFISIWGQLTGLPSRAFTTNRRVSLSFGVTEVF